MSIRIKAIGAARWTSVSSIVRAVIQTVQLLVVARFVTQADIGRMAIIMSVIVFIQLIADFGISNAVMNAKELGKNILSTIFWMNLIIGISVFFLLFLVSPFLAMTMRDQSITEPLWIASASIIFMSSTQLIKVRSEKRFDFRKIATIEISSSCVGASLTVILAIMGHGVYALALGYLVTSVVTSLAYWIFARNGWLPNFRIDFRATQPIIRMGFLFSGTSFLFAFAQNVDILIVGRLLGTSELGNYALPRDLCLKIVFMISPIATRVLLPLVADNQNDVNALARLVQGALRVISFVTFPIFGLITFFPSEIVRLAFGEVWAPASTALSALGVASMFRCLVNPLGTLAYGTGRARSVGLQSVLTLVGVTLSSFIGSNWGASGTGIAIAIFYFTQTIIAWKILIQPIASIGLGSYLAIWLPPLFATIVSGVVGSVISQVVDGDFTRVVAGGATGVLVYIVYAIAFDRRSLADIFNIAANNLNYIKKR